MILQLNCLLWKKRNPDAIARLVWFVWADVKAANQAPGDRLIKDI